jgi:hypothetical protein
MALEFPYVLIRLLGQDFKFRFDMWAIHEFQQATKNLKYPMGLNIKDFDRIEHLVNEDVSIAFKLIWSGVHGFDEKITVKDVARMLDFKELETLVPQVMEYVSSTLGFTPKNPTRANQETEQNQKNGPGKEPSKQPEELESSPKTSTI